MKMLAKLLISALLLSPVLVFAQGIGSTTAPGPLIKDAAHMRLQGWQQAIKNRFASTTQELKQRRQELKTTFAQDREAIIAQMRQGREELLDLLHQKQASTTELIKEKRAQIKDAQQQRRADILEQYFVKVASFFQDRISKLSAIAEKLSQRITDLQTQKGVDLSSASNLLNDAQGLIDDATTKANDFSDKASQAIDPTTASSTLQQLKNSRRDTQNAIKAAHDRLVDVLAAIKAVVNQASTINQN